MAWQFDGKLPIYLQIKQRVTTSIVSGEYPPGSRLASVRELAAEAGVNPNTMQKALSELENTELVYSVRTGGRFVTDNADTIHLAKRALAERSIRQFLSDMKKIGVGKEEITALLSETEE